VTPRSPSCRQHATAFLESDCAEALTSGDSYRVKQPRHSVSGEGIDRQHAGAPEGGPASVAARASLDQRRPTPLCAESALDAGDRFCL
jgi:hypothetical protein